MMELINGGLDEELETSQEEEAVDNPEPAKPKRKPFYDWEVGGETYRMKLTTAMVCAVEEKYKTNLLNLIAADGVPRLSTMLTIAQAAITPWRHGVKYSMVQNLFDRYVEEGGDQISFFSDVIMGTMAASGFFTQKQMEEISEKIQRDAREDLQI